ncbi:putative sugar nucleotidyl transferase [Albibacterium profundi]|uniref:Sugar nucleotidyl transferase n=1 Tax=Albibacterium profundi TaxID=3134906 RepID=A0ABV5CAM8_9SPHI
MQVVLYDRATWRKNLYPLSLTRPVSNLRTGIWTIDEKWSNYLHAPVSFLTENYLAKKYSLIAPQGTVLVIRGNVLPDKGLLDAIENLKVGQGLRTEQEVIALKYTEHSNDSLLELDMDQLHFTDMEMIDYHGSVSQIRYPEDLFLHNEAELNKDFESLTKGRASADLSSTNRVLGERIFVDDGVSAECANFNTLKGPIYLGKNSQVWEGSSIRGAFSLGEQSIVKMGTKIYSNVSVGPHCKVAGELNTSVVWGNSNKGHDGYLGSAVVGEWCNLGAGTSNSNMKNNSQAVKMYHYGLDDRRDTGLGFCGVIIGDHMRSAINTSFNTGTVVGICSNVFGAGMPPTFVPDFSWGGSEGMNIYDIDKMFQTCELVFQRRNSKFDEIEKEILRFVFDLTTKYRKN